MAKLAQKPCACPAFADALRTGFIEQIGDELFLASRESFGGNVTSLLYGPKINHCPFCGTALEPHAVLPPETMPS